MVGRRMKRVVVEAELLPVSRLCSARGNASPASMLILRDAIRSLIIKQYCNRRSQFSSMVRKFIKFAILICIVRGLKMNVYSSLNFLSVFPSA